MQFPDEDAPELIFSYSRADAVADGILVEVSPETLQEAGIRFLTAISAELWYSTIVPDEKSRAAGQSEAGRLWDVLMVFREAAKQSNESILKLSVVFTFGGTAQRDVVLKSICVPGDSLEPVITIMLPHED